MSLTPLPALLVDIGNSRVKWSMLSSSGRSPTQSTLHRGEEDHQALFQRSWGDLERPIALYVANVGGGSLMAALGAWTGRHWGLEPIRLLAQRHCLGVTNAYADPERLGVDRWLALVAAHRAYSGPLCLLDSGSAITIDGLAADGQHLGGLILPGLRLMREALLQGTSLERTEAASIHTLLARDTATAIAAAAPQACVALVERVCHDIEGSCGSRPRLVVTGGDAPLLLPLWSLPVHQEPDLVMQGLMLVVMES